MALIASLMLFALCELLLWVFSPFTPWLARYTPRGPDGDPLVIAAKTRSLSEVPPHSAPACFLGSSQVREGIDCAIVSESAKGLDCFNLAISAGTPLDALQIREAIDAQVSRRTLVLGIFPKVMHLPPKEGFSGVSVLACALRGSPLQVWYDRDRYVFGLFQSAIPSLRFKDALHATRRELAGKWTDAWRGDSPPAPDRLTRDEWAQPPRYFRERIGRLDGDSAQIGPYTPTQERALEQLISGERRRGSRLVVVDFPTRPGFETTLPRSAASHWSRLVATLRSRADLHFVGRDDLPPLATEHFIDFTHLNSSGRQLVSRRLGEILASLPDRARLPGAAD